MVSDPSNHWQCHELKKGLIILRGALDLGELTIEAYRGTPLGRILNDAIGKESERCLEVLQGLRSVIEAYQPTLVSTSINFLRGRFLGSGHESDELDTWRRKLSECQGSIVGYLQVLDSCVPYRFDFMQCCFSNRSSMVYLRASWKELGNGVRSGSVSPEHFNRFLHQKSGSLPYIHVKILVVDHLGRNLPIPIVFCSTLEV